MLNRIVFFSLAAFLMVSPAQALIFNESNVVQFTKTYQNKPCTNRVTVVQQPEKSTLDKALDLIGISNSSVVAKDEIEYSGIFLIRKNDGVTVECDRDQQPEPSTGIICGILPNEGSEKTAFITPKSCNISGDTLTTAEHGFSGNILIDLSGGTACQKIRLLCKFNEAFQFQNLKSHNAEELVSKKALVKTELMNAIQTSTGGTIVIQ